MANLDSRLKVFAELTGEEHKALDALTRESSSFGRAAVVAEGGGHPAYFVLRRGVVASSVRLTDGEQQVLRIHFAGDLMGLEGLVRTSAFDRLTALTECVVSRFEPEALDELFAKHPRLGARLFAYAQAEHLVLLNRLRGAGRDGSGARIARLLVHLHDRMQAAGATAAPLPISQAQLGQMAGLSRMHVQRVSRDMTRTGLIVWGRNAVQLARVDALRALAGEAIGSPQERGDWLKSRLGQCPTNGNC